MARLDFYAGPDGRGWWLDVQADVLGGLNTRLVVPMLPMKDAPRPAWRLNPVVTVDGVPCVLVTQYLAAVPVAAMGRRVGTLSDQAEAVSAALEMVFVGV